MKITSIDEFLKSISKLEYIYRENDSGLGIYYRGQSNVKFKDISPGIMREAGFLRHEHDFYHEILNERRMDFKEFKSPFEILAKMQHYNTPTRLIDITTNPLIALFFAVENLDNKEDGEVFIFIKKLYDIDSVQVKIKSILSTTNNYSIDNIKKIYFSYYREHISDEEIIQNIGKVTFIKLNKDKRLCNERLNSQAGSFCICGNEVMDDKIIEDVLCLKKSDAYKTIRIQYEYKDIIKKELDEKYDINFGTVYPELQSYANHLRDKYRLQSKSIDNSYYIYKEDTFKKLNYIGINITVSLNERLNKEEIEYICREIVKKYKSKYRVIWIFVANSDEDIVIFNWIARVQYIDEMLDSRLAPNSIGPLDGNNIAWQFSSGTSAQNEFYNKYIFEDSKDILIFSENLRNKVDDIIKLIINPESEYEGLALLQEKSDYIKKIYLEFNNDCGISKDFEFEKFKQHYSTLFCHLDNICINLDGHAIDNRLKQNIQCYIDGVRESEAGISSDKDSWMNKLGINYSDLSKGVKMKELNYPMFKQTIPISDNAIEVYVEAKHEIMNDGKVKIIGNTNLYDYASMLVNIYCKENKYMASSKVTVINGNFTTEKFSDRERGLPKGTYIVSISLSIPSIQSKEFLKKSGIEYENLIGDFIKREDTNLYGEYNFEFNIEK
ncbi:FRG domain-containing protein [[Clostridium] sordellii]|uniref:FRG domain-containing protein n=1 Tax=Paraclostridium sordellii TaxID=1505 RepID=UPI0005E8FC5B|nr:FRG domain-containing protein [Paeniclostridium sordellii]CEP94663.1 FRG domain-containing protein [[Clostridium] sordellii] [Paeniclostridium sordellii]